MMGKILERTIQLLEAVLPYKPEEARDDQLADDWRIFGGWYSTLKTAGQFKYTQEEILYKFTVPALIEILKRGKQEFHPENWKDHPRELYLKAFRKIKDQGIKIPENIEKVLKEALEFQPADWDAELMAKESNDELLGRLGVIADIFKARGSNPQDEEVINAYILLGAELDKRGLEWTQVPELEEHAKKLREGIRPAFGSPGGKKLLSKIIVSYIPEHKIYVEPFIGGGAVYFAKKPSESEILNDKDSEIAFAYKFIKAGKFENLKKFKMDGEREYFEKLKEKKPSSDIERFHKFIYLLHFSYGNARGNFAPSIIQRRDRGDGTCTIASRVNHLPKVSERLKNTKVYNQDFRDMIKQFDSPNAFFYFDPPYPEQQGKLKTDLTNEDLLEALRKIKGKWILSISSKGNIKELFKNYHIKSLTLTRTFDNLHRHEDKEFIIANFPFKKSQTWLAEGFLDSFILDAKEEIDEIGPIIWKPNYISLSGSTLYAKDRMPNDPDVIFRDSQLDAGITIKLQRLFKRILGDEPHFVPSPSGPNWRHFPLYHLALIPVKDAQFIEIGDEEPGFAKKFYEQEPRAASPEVKKEIEDSAKQDRIKMFRMFQGMKPTRAAKPNHRMSIDYFISLFKPEDFKAGILSSKKYDGMRVLIFRDGKRIEIWSEDGENVTNRLPKTIDALSKINGDEYIIDAEIELWKEGKHQPREAIAGYIHAKTEPDDSGVVANIFTVLYHNGEDLHKKPEIERQRILEKFGIPQSTWSIPRVDFHLNRVPNLLSHTPEKLRKDTIFVSKQIGSEGNVAKKTNSVYYLDGRSRGGWIKWHSNALIYGIVIKRNPTKVETVFNYDYGIFPGKYKIREEDLIEVEGKKYVKVGTTFNTDEKKNRGDLIAVECETLNLIDNKKRDTFEVTAWAPRYIYLDKTEEPIPEKADTIEAVVEKARKNRVLQKKTITEEGVTLYESTHPTWEDLIDCQNLEDFSKLAEVLSLPQEEFPEGLEEESRFESERPSIKFKEFIREEKRPLKEYPKDYGVILNHFRGKSVHIDFRRKQNGYLEGETIMNAPAGLVTEDVDTLAKARKWNKVLLEKGKFRPDMDPTKKAVLVGKARQPLEWLNVREVVYPPGSVGATRYEWGAFVTMDEGMAYPGVQRPYFKEFFLDMKHFKEKRMVERAIGVSPEWEKPPKAPIQWQTWTNMADETPYILSKRQRKDKRDYIPEEGEKAIPPWWEEKIKPEHRWWVKGLKPKERMKRLDLAFNDLIEQGFLKHIPIEIKEETLQEKKAEFTLRFRWWMGPKVVRELPATDSQFELLIDSGKNYLDRWDFKGKFYGDPTKQPEVIARRKTMNIGTPNTEPFKKWMDWEGSIPAKDSKLEKVVVISKENNIYQVRVQEEDGQSSPFPTKPTFAKFKPGQEVWIDQWKNIYTGPKGGIAYGNPNERLPVYIDIKDFGDVELIEETDQFISFKFDGKLLKGYYVIRREDPKSDIWIFSKGKLPGEKIEKEALFESETSTISTQSFDFTNSDGFPVEIKYQNNTYNLILTKNDKLLLNKK
jgi:DNA adenine methylase